MKTKDLRQSVTFNAKPAEVYDALMNSRKHAKFTGAPCSISTKVGGKFSAFEGYLAGENLELVKNKKIVQKWHTVKWPKGHYSRVTFRFKPHMGGTRMSFYHSGIPAPSYDSIKKGWYEHYWEPMKEMFNN